MADGIKGCCIYYDDGKESKCQCKNCHLLQCLIHPMRSGDKGKEYFKEKIPLYEVPNAQLFHFDKHWWILLKHLSDVRGVIAWNIQENQLHVLEEQIKVYMAQYMIQNLFEEERWKTFEDKWRAEHGLMLKEV